MLRNEDVQASGGDWAGYGELTGQPLLDFISAGKLSVMFANKAVLVGVQLDDGTTGTYVLPHVADIANFQ